VLLGGLSAQGAPWLVFTDSPGSLAITQLPWVLIPAMIVPIYFLIHFVIGVRLRKLARETRRASLDLVLALRSA
jgi:Na+/pantothenate symporter